MARNVIELNGQQYDATTGTPVVASTKRDTAKKSVKTATKNTPQHLDGFSRRPGSTKRSRTTVSHAVHAKPSKSQTLMRSGVKKPMTAPKIHAKAGAAVATKPAETALPVVGSVKPGRAIRATHATKSSFISKFGDAKAAIKSEVIAVQPAPITISHHKKEVLTTPPLALDSKAAIAKADPFKSAIDQATGHNQPKLKKAKTHHRIAKRLHVSPRFVTFSGVIVAIMAIGGVVAYQNMPELAMKLAATRAGFNANLPAYQPAGFALTGPIKYDDGEVTVNYKSNSDERTFDVTQKNSSWNSETLLENFVSTTNQPYQTFQANGRTIYIYDGNKATWVDGGVWFNIDGKTNLNSDQLLRIADSL